MATQTGGAGATGAIGGLGAALAGLTGVILPPSGQGPMADRCRRLGDIVDRYAVRRALSGVLFGSLDVISGSVIRLPADETDFALRGRLPLAWSRHYSSARRAIGLLGAGWRTGWEVTLHKDGDRLVYVDEVGSRFDLPFPELGSLVIVSSGQLHVAHLPDGQLVVADLVPHYRVFGEFDTRGVARLKYVEDLHRQRIGCIWDEAGRLLRMRGTCGHELRMHYETHGTPRLSAIECVAGGPTGALVRYAYGANGELIQVRDRAGEYVRRYAYRHGSMVEAVTPLGMTARYSWQERDGVARVTERITSEGAHERLAYDPQRRRTEVTDVFGHAAFWQCDDRGNVTSYTDFDGRRYGFDYVELDAPAAIHLPAQRTVRIEYDSLGRVARETDPQGGVRTTQYAFASRAPTVVTTSDGRLWMWARNERLQPMHHQTPSGEIVRFAYDVDGLAVGHTDAHGLETRVTYNRWGQLTQHTTPDGATTRYEYDRNGYLVGVTDVLGALTRIQRDVHGRALAVLRPDGRVERHVWNAAGQRISFVGANGASRHWHRDRRGKVVRMVDEEGHVVVRRYDAHGRLLRVDSANGGVQQLEWGSRDCLSISDADGVVHRFDYTDAGWIGAMTSTAGTQRRRETFARDAMGRLIARETRQARYTYRYDACGRLQAASRAPTDEGVQLGIDADEVRFDYDADGHPITESGAAGELRHTYDAVGRRVITRLPPGQDLRTRRYSSGDIALVELGDREIAQFWYDAACRPIARRLGGLVVHIGYLPLGRPLWWRAVTTDDPGVPSEPTERDRQLWRVADYGAADEIVATHGPTEDPTWYDYDRRGCLVRCVSECNGIEYFTWDGAYNLLDLPGERRPPPVYADHRIGESHGYHYDYDAWGRLVNRHGRDHALSLDWNDEGQLIAVHRRGCTVRYRYDALGRRIEKRVERAARGRTPAGDELTRYLWQGRRLVQEQRGRAWRTYLYQPEPDGTLGFAPLACLDQTLDEHDAIEATVVYYYHTDGAGTALALSDAHGEVVWRSQTRAWGEPLAPAVATRSDAPAQPLRFAGQHADEDIPLHYNGRRFYDPCTGRYVSPDRSGPGGISPYRYAPNPLTWCNPLGAARPMPFPHVAAAGASAANLVPDPAQQIAGLIEQVDDIPGWHPFER